MSPKFRPKQDETLPLPDEDPTGRGGGFQIRKVSKKGATAFEATCADYHNQTVTQRRALEREAQARSREAQKAAPVSTPEECAANLRWMAEAAAESRRRWLSAKRANGV